jgi:hypothetical protein
MAFRSIVAVALLGCFTSSISFGKERPRWIDPPPDLSASVAPPAETMPMMPYDQDVEATGSIQMPVEASATLLRDVPDAATRSACTTRTYTVLSGATIRVHSC